MLHKAIWLVRLLYRHDGLTKQEILEAWRDEDDRGRAMAASTFYDNRRYLETRYGLRLENQGGRYRLSAASAGDDAVLRHLSGETVAASGFADEPHGPQWIPMLSEAIEMNRPLRMEYVPLDKPSYETTFEPYCLRRAQGHSYAVGRSSRHGEVRTFALDRIGSLCILPGRFRRAANFCADAWFEHSVGAFGGAELTPEHVVLAPASPRIAAYLRSRPLHASQRETPAGDGTVCFELDVALTRDFLGQLLSFGTDVRVLAPQVLRQRLRDELQGMLDRL